MKLGLKKTISAVLVFTYISLVADPANSRASQDKCKSAELEASAIRNQANSLQEQIRRDQEAMRRLGFDKKVQEIESWQRLADDAKRDLVKASLDHVITDALLYFEKTIKVAGSLNPVTANKMIDELTLAGHDFEPLVKSIELLRYLESTT